MTIMPDENLLLVNFSFVEVVHEGGIQINADDEEFYHLKHSTFVWVVVLIIQYLIILTKMMK